jgi:hypothetical protein
VAATEGLAAVTTARSKPVPNLCVLQMDLKSLSLDEKKCFFLNLYNMLVCWPLLFLCALISPWLPDDSRHHLHRSTE